MKNLSFLFLLLTATGFRNKMLFILTANPFSNVYFDPLKCYSKRLDRRTNQNIPLDLKDVPVELTYISQVKMHGDNSYGKIEVAECAPYSVDLKLPAAHRKTPT
jgi:hypothetical protein